MRVLLVVVNDAPAEVAHRVLAALPRPWIAGRVGRRVVDMSSLLDRARHQVEATRLLDVMPEADEPYHVALVGVDLFIHPLAWVCGVAPLGSRRGVVSIARLAQGLRAGSPALLDRVAKEVTHELGHAAGLVHCPVPDCVMHASLSPDEIDLKRVDYCMPCLVSLRTMLGPAT